MRLNVHIGHAYIQVVDGGTEHLGNMYIFWTVTMTIVDLPTVHYIYRNTDSDHS